MDKENIALVIAQNGLKTAATLLLAKKIKLEKQLSKAKLEEQDALRQRILKAEKLAIALNSADAGINEYTAQVAAL